jgi:hypothetical protein
VAVAIEHCGCGKSLQGIASMFCKVIAVRFAALPSVPMVNGLLVAVVTERYGCGSLVLGNACKLYKVIAVG